jgi:RHS repeat-associated protein
MEIRQGSEKSVGVSGPLGPRPRARGDHRTQRCVEANTHERGPRSRCLIACGLPEHTGYDNDGELTDTTDEDGRRTTYSYNADGDQTGETWVGASPSEKITYTYDADNEMTGAADSFATLTFTYDNDGWLATDATSGPGSGQPTVTLTYSYDQLGDETSVTDSLTGSGAAGQGITTYTYSAAQQVTGITTSYGGTSGPQVSYTYDNASRLTNISRSVSSVEAFINTTIIYDNANRVVTMTDGANVFKPTMFGWVNTPLATYVYSYDNASRVTSEQDAEGPYTYSYDNANELTSAFKNGTQAESYSYDLNGNRTGSGYSTTIMNETATSPGTTYTYDTAGNMLTSKTGSTITTYTYDYHNRLTEVTTGGTIVATYTYNALNQRIGVDDNGTQTWTIYDGKSPDANPYADFNGSGSLTERYLFGPGVVSGAVMSVILARTNSGGTTAWYLEDNLGSVRDVVDTSGNELDHIVYDSFGSIVTETNASNGDRFKFAGMQYDAMIGQYYDHARWYGSTQGRFLGEDPSVFAAGDPNLYRYVDNGPDNDVDPTGLISWSDYWYYLNNPGQMDPGLKAAQDIAWATANMAWTAASILTGVGMISAGAKLIGSLAAGGAAGITVGGMVALLAPLGTRAVVVASPAVVCAAIEGTFQIGVGTVLCAAGMIHGNSYASPKLTTLYVLKDQSGNLLKWGITQDTERRYSRTFLNDKILTKITSGSRAFMAELERFLVQTNPGPLNFEQWRAPLP